MSKDEKPQTSKTVRDTRIDKRAQIIRHVYEVFYQTGFHAAGLDLLLEGSGISKRTLYKYFASKEELIAETVRYYGGLYRQALKQRLRHRAHLPLERILAAFEAQQQLVGGHGFQGCFALKAMLEYESHDAGILAATQTIYDELLGFFAKACRELEDPDPDARAQQLLMLFRGAVISSQNCKTARPFELARAAAVTLCRAG